MQNWNPDGPNAVTVPEGVVDLLIAPVCAFLRLGALGIPSRYDEKMVDPSYIVQGVTPGTVEIAGDVVELPERLRIVGVRVLGRGAEKEPTVFETGPRKKQRRDIDPESVSDDEAGLEVRSVRRWNLIEVFDLPAGRAAAAEEFKAKKSAATKAALGTED